MADAWELAGVAAAGAGIRIAPLTELEDCARINEVIGRVWGEQIFTPESIRAFQHAGCVLLGARPAAADEAAPLVGFVLGFLGFEGAWHLHSHMLAVVPEWRANGAGVALKLAQRAAALDIGIGEIRWTYDPLLLPNARFNLARLGARGTAFLPNFYGEMTDELNRGERSDRFDVAWDLSSAAVERTAAGASAHEPSPSVSDAPRLLVADGDPDAPSPVAAAGDPTERAVVSIPRDHLALRRRDPRLARTWRDAAAEAFVRCFGAGLVATWISPEGEYLFEREER